MSKVLDSVSKSLNEKLVQVSIVGAILFYLVASPMIFNFVRHNFEHVLRAVGWLREDREIEGTKVVLLNSVVFGFLLYFSAKYLLGPVVGALKRK
tara:strand:+ start:5949 stop:6233 length:285 start_codon:yes stop_codon:yes gene_type:complete